MRAGGWSKEKRRRCSDIWICLVLDTLWAGIQAKWGGRKRMGGRGEIKMKVASAERNIYNSMSNKENYKNITIINGEN